VRGVHHRDHAVALGDHLEPSRRRGDVREGVGDGRRLTAAGDDRSGSEEPVRDGDGVHGRQRDPERVAVDDEPPDEAPLGFPGIHDPETSALPHLDQAGSPPAHGGAREIPLRGVRRQHRHAVGPEILLEQPQLRAPVGVDAPVDVEVIPLEAGGDGDVDLHPGEQAIGQDADERLERDRRSAPAREVADEVREVILRAADVGLVVPTAHVGDPRRVHSGGGPADERHQLAGRGGDAGLAVGPRHGRDERTRRGPADGLDHADPP
jgi:hypothetical protein